MRPAALIEFRCVRLNPPPNAAGIHRKTTLGQHLRHMLVRQRISQVPPNGQKDHLARVVTSLEWIARRDWHRSHRIRPRRSKFAMEPSNALKTMHSAHDTVEH